MSTGARFHPATALTLLSLLTAFPVLAQEEIAFSIQPDSSNPVWHTPGIKFQKFVECSYSNSDRAIWPLPSEEAIATRTAKATLFKAAVHRADGTYRFPLREDEYNTLFVPLSRTRAAVTLVCRGAILANGKDVTRDADNAIASSSLESIEINGPMTVRVSLDVDKLANLAH